VTNEDDAKNLMDPDYRQSIARALYTGIRAYAEERNRPTAMITGVSRSPRTPHDPIVSRGIASR
jgi:hypothetical protein